MRTTISIDEHLLREAKKVALSSRTNLSGLIETALKEMLARRHRKGKRSPLKLVTFRGKGLRFGVDLDDTASLLDLMEGG
jgi:hypothetical protein